MNCHSPQIAVRVGQLLRLALSTDKSGEACASLAAIRRTLAAAGLDLHQLSDALVIGLQAPSQPSIEGWRAMAQACSDRSDLMTEKERRFVVVLLSYSTKRPSEKQTAWLAAIAERIGA